MIQFRPNKFFSEAEVEEFTRAYVAAMLWSTIDEEVYKDGEGPDDCLDKRYDIDNVDPECLEQIMEECRQFMADNQLKLKACAGLGDYANPQWSLMERAGHDFALTRNGHGAGFWDRNLGELGDQLSEACKRYGESYWYASGGFVYCH